ncbi:hypothetical protein A7978_04800 (plasmid) [Borrelia turicatae]|uniref:Protein BptA n=2 Tax=Borrelia turicatae TaxID=142 RepID=T1ECP8_BORT9|nr:hypothetical protein [Borrelia turicatae]ADN26521.1 hypothetical protein BTA092 [Borrelia turicatae 91E135]ANF34432.1 hypothetical protein A7978_04800 [Borrelia turicatae]UPA14018.1 hypothetical protein bt91E135_001182 [Borrelia turicatae 91E135]UPA15510.1 hypothetical protein btBTE5EL_001192 [Borrelia turicatae]
MDKIKSFLFKIYIFLLICFCMFFMLFFTIYLSDLFSNRLFTTREHYFSNPYTSMIRENTCFKEFGFQSIKNIFFRESYVNEDSSDFKSLQDAEREKIVASHPSFTLRLQVVDKGRLMKFKNVVFDGVDAIYNDKITKPEFNSSDEPYFSIIGNSGVDQKYLGEYSVKVVNDLTIAFNEALFRVLREQEKLKITLISHDDVEYSIETGNFLSDSRFDILH